MNTGKKKLLRRLVRWTAAVVAAPVALFLLAAVLLYVPPVQNFVVRQVAARLSATLRMDIGIERVRLAFPLDLSVQRLHAVERGDTLAALRALRLNVRLRPLLEGRADIDGFSIFDAVLDTKSYVSDTRVKGRIGKLAASAHGIDWKNERIRLDRAELRDADVAVSLSDTAAADTTPSTARWDIVVARADIANTAVSLSMPGDTMRVSARLGAASLRGGRFDTGRSFYAVRSLSIRDGEARYDLPRVMPARGLDPSHVAVDRLALQLDTLSYAADGTLKAGLRRLTLREKSGLVVNSLSGEIYLDTAQIRLPALRLFTPVSKVAADVALDWRALTAGKGGRAALLLDASIGHEDVLTLAAGFADRGLLSAYPRRSLIVKADVSGNLDRLTARQLDVSLPGILRLRAKGHVRHATSRHPAADVAFQLDGEDLRPLAAFLPADMRKSFALPRRVSAKGTAQVNGSACKADLRLRADGGTLAARAKADTRRETYALQAAARSLPLGQWLPGSGLGSFTGSVKAEGSSFDVLSAAARLRAAAQVDAFAYGSYDLGGLRLNASLEKGHGRAEFVSENALLQGSGTVEARIGRRYDVTLAADIPMIDATRLASLKDTLQVGASVRIDAYAEKNFKAYGVSGSIENLRFLTTKKSIPAKDIDFAFATSPDTTKARLGAGDLLLRLASKGDIAALSSRLSRFGELLGRQLADKRLDQNALKRELPEMSFYLDAGKDNPLSNILRIKQYDYSSAYVNLNASPEEGLNGSLRVGALKSGGLLLDTIVVDIAQDTSGVQANTLVHNYTKRNPHKFEARVKSYLLSRGAGVELVYLDEKREKGIDLGVRADLAPGGISVHLYPETPIIAYRRFKLNDKNYLYMGANKQVYADLALVADDGTSLSIYGEPNDSINDLTLNLNRVNLSELSDVMPFMPRLDGMLDADLHVIDDHSNYSAMATVNTQSLKFEEAPLGNIGLEAIYLPQGGGEHQAHAFISSDGADVLKASGTYYDRDGGYFEGEAKLQDCPLQLLNGFMAGTDVAFAGRAGGSLDIKGTTDKPQIDGTLDMDSAHVFSDVYGFDFAMDEQPVVIAGSKLSFTDYALRSTGRNPLYLNGSVDLSDFSSIGLDLSMNASDFELINTKKKAQSLVFGRVYANYSGSLRGTPDNLRIKGALDILDRTDVTYILKDSPLSVDDRLHDLVQFVSFEDSVVTEEKAVPAGGFDMLLTLSINDAARFHCNLSEDGQNYVDLEGGGDLTFRLTPQGDMRLTGRFTANSGEMKYSLPVIPLKTFNLVQGSYVEFTGNALNPTLSIAAKERMKAVVTENDQPRTVAFDVGVALSKPLEEMGLEFTVEAPEDLTVQNQLAAMSADQRGKVAVAMMATGMYITDTNSMSGGGFKANNALNAFLQSEIQSIAGSALKTIDINLGVESNTSADGASTTDYSFQFAKRFWGDRISVIIGGKVSSGEDAQNSAESFIDNVSVEYRLDKSSTRYVKMFYDRDTQDPLEGQLTKTGAGIVLRRKTDRLGELFIFRTPKKKTAAAAPAATSSR